VEFGENGEWTESKTLAVQYQGIKNNDLDQFTKAGTRKIMFPADIKTGEVKHFNELR
jgi:carbamoylphosphate synthase small subunit